MYSGFHISLLFHKTIHLKLCVFYSLQKKTQTTEQQRKNNKKKNKNSKQIFNTVYVYALQ